MKRPTLPCTCTPEAHPCASCVLWESYARYLARKRRWRKSHLPAQRARERARYLRMKIEEPARYDAKQAQSSGWQRAHPAECRRYQRRWRAKRKETCHAQSR